MGPGWLSSVLSAVPIAGNGSADFSAALAGTREEFLEDLLPARLTLEEADRIASDHFAPVYEKTGGAYRAVRAAELPAYDKAYYQARWNLPREYAPEDVLLGSGGFFVSLSDGAVEEVGSGACMYAGFYLRARDHIPSNSELPIGELAALLAQYSCDDLITMCRKIHAGPFF
jgi:hypothetical protein